MTMTFQADGSARVLLIYTGGTIGMAPRDGENLASPLEAKPLDKLLEYVPDLEPGLTPIGRGIYLDYENLFEQPLDSCDITALHWVEMAKCVRKNYNQYDGFVILHGTDTMAYTASALAFILEHLAKPVVVTGSQLPVSNKRTDAIRNLMSAVHIAGWKAVDLACIPEVVICFHDEIMRGCRATKERTTDFDGFESPNFPLLGKIGEYIEINEELINREVNAEKELKIRDIAKPTRDRKEILDIGLYPGFKAAQLDAILNLPNVRGVVLRTFGAGNAPSDPAFLDVLEKAIKRTDRPPCHILNVTQCIRGMVEMGLYANSSGLLERGVISGLDMTKEAALAKLYWALASYPEGQIASALQISQRGEQSQNLFDLKYGSAEPFNRKSPFVRAVHPDNRLDVSARVKRAIVRLSDVVFDSEAPALVSFLLFLNEPAPGEHVTSAHDRCVATFEVDWQGHPVFLNQDITDALQDLDPGLITLAVVPQAGVTMAFAGLYLALSSRASLFP